MANIIDYDIVLPRMQAIGMRCLYYNSGAFGPVDRARMKATGWIGPDDPSIRAEALAIARRIPPPYESTLATLATRAWMEIFPGPVWVMPKSNWAYELDFGSKTWMPAALERIGIDPAQLAQLTNAAAIEFSQAESQPFCQFVQTLLENLFGSDFALAFADRPVTCTVHHHKQLWWTTTDQKTIDSLNASAFG